MQFQYNADYPPDATPAAVPVDFPAAQPLACARITTRVQRTNGEICVAENVLVRTQQPARAKRLSVADLQQRMEYNLDTMEFDDSNSSSSDSDFDDDDMGDDNGEDEQHEVYAYWIQRTIREAIYGRVLLAVILRKLPTETIWRVIPGQQCAVKELDWQHIRRERDRLAEDPVKEVSAMQYFKEWLKTNRLLQQKQQNSDGKAATERSIESRTDDAVSQSFRDMIETNVMMPLDLLSDDRHLYSVMPFCNGGELFELLDMNERFTEPEARYWMRHVLNGLENLQHAGICHRDMSLENLLVHESGALIIDMGMCLRIPYLPTEGNSLAATTAITTSKNGAVTASLAGMTIDQDIALRENGDGSIYTDGQGELLRGRPRHLITPQGTCGKWIYMSPEIYQNSAPFDGHAVDMWAAGVILFLMLTGFPPWDRASQTDERFRYMSAGYLVQMLTEWEIPISPDAMDLLQRMLFLDPKDRLCLDQVRAHPWMINGQVQPPNRMS